MFRYAWKSFTRRRTRSSLAVTGIALSVALLIAVLSISNSVQEAIGSALGAAGADMVVQKRVKPCPFAEVKLPKDLAEIPADLVGKLEAMEQVESVSGVLLLWAFWQGHPTVVAGIDPTKKTIGPVRISTREEGDKEDEKSCCAVKEGRYLVQYDDNAAMLTKEYAEAIKASVGDMIHLGPKEMFKVVGIVELTGTARIAEAQAFIPLKAAQRMYGQGEIVDTIFIALKRLKDTDLVAAAVTQWIGPETSITTTENVDAGTSAVANVTRKSLLGVSVLVMVFVLLLLVRNSLSAVAERLSEVGLLRAIGWRRSEVSRLFVLEEWFAGVIGGVVGCTAGWMLSVAYSKLADLELPEALNSQPPCTPVAPARSLMLAITPDLEVLAIGLLTALLIGAIAGFAASGRASRLDPADALRRL
ncbi:MAG: ABC transporter permease [Armatimonadetes bacterium]|nr:ABC transporter permease [Armatimonadota bacterium]